MQGCPSLQGFELLQIPPSLHLSGAGTIPLKMEQRVADQDCGSSPALDSISLEAAYSPQLNALAWTESNDKHTATSANDPKLNLGRDIQALFPVITIGAVQIEEIKMILRKQLNWPRVAAVDCVSLGCEYEHENFEMEAPD